jgi:hypothetical protein
LSQVLISSFFGGRPDIVGVRASPRISSYSYSVRRGGRYSVKRYSYSMAVWTAAMPIVDRSGSRELGDLWVGLLYKVASSTSSSTVRRGGLSTSTRRGTNKVVDRSARSGVFYLCNVSSPHSVDASRYPTEILSR